MSYNRLEEDGASADRSSAPQTAASRDEQFTTSLPPAYTPLPENVMSPGGNVPNAVPSSATPNNEALPVRASIAPPAYSAIPVGQGQGQGQLQVMPVYLGNNGQLGPYGNNLQPNEPVYVVVQGSPAHCHGVTAHELSRRRKRNRTVGLMICFFSFAIVAVVNIAIFVNW